MSIVIQIVCQKQKGLGCRSLSIKFINMYFMYYLYTFFCDYIKYIKHVLVIMVIIDCIY